MNLNRLITHSFSRRFFSNKRIPPHVNTIFQDKIPSTFAEQRNYKPKYILTRSSEQAWRDATYVEYTIDNIFPGFKEGFGLFLLYVLYDQGKKMFSDDDEHGHH